MRVINIRWTGPYSLSEVCGTSGTGKGIYQIYSHHPVYGHALVYIGKTFASFGGRIRQEGWDTGAENDPLNIEVYLGELIGEGSSVSEEIWRKEIDLAEALLIHAHGPAYNSTYVINPPKAEAVGDVVVRNWGAVRSLAREISGEVWTNRALSFRNLPVYQTGSIETDDPTGPKE